MGLDSDSVQAAAVGLFLAGLAIFMVVMVVGLGALMFWGILRKAGKPAWHSLVPVYQWVQVARVGGKPSWWGWVCGLGQVLPLLSWAAIVPSFTAAPTSGNPVNVPPGFGILALTWPLSIAAFVFQILIAIGIARSFGKSDGWAAGLVLLGYVFYPIIGLGPSPYLGPGGISGYSGYAIPPPPPPSWFIPPPPPPPAPSA